MSERHTQNGSSHEGDRFPGELLTAYALDQLAGAERGEIERMLANPAQGEACRIVAETRRIAEELPAANASPAESPVTASSTELRSLVEKQLQQPITDRVELPVKRRPWYRLTLVEVGVVVSICCLLAAMLFPGVQAAREASRRMSAGNNVKQLQMQVHLPSDGRPDEELTFSAEGGSYRYQHSPLATTSDPMYDGSGQPAQQWFDRTIQQQAEQISAGVANDMDAAPIQVDLSRFGDDGALQTGPARNIGTSLDSGLTGRDKGDLGQVGEGQPRSHSVKVWNGQSQFQSQGEGQSVKLAVTPRIIVQEASESELALVEKGRESVRDRSLLTELHGSERYEAIHENLFLAPRQNPLSTFSIDVDTASYANMRRFLTGGSLPPPDAVRIEELVNYFRYDYPQPKGPEPFSVNMEVAECPWAESHLLLRVGLKGKEVHRGERPASNLVFLLDVSGSMADENKLPLLKTAMQMFTRELGENDRVSIVTYAGEAGLRLPPTRGHEQAKILAAIESLSSGGSTNGSAGIDLAYEQAKAYFVEGGTNRVILCTDGDLNVGITDDEALVQLIKQKAGGGTFLTVLGFGEGNLQDAKMEKLADNGNGLYAYIDSVREARKVLVEQMTGSTITIAKDVKIQIEFNPAVIASYRLLGYENRVLAAQDFNDDKKDAGEIGAGHTVTALYELVPVGAKPEAAVPAGLEPLKYQAAGERERGTGDGGQEPEAKLTEAAKSGELLTLKLRYKEPEGQVSKLLEVPLKDRGGKFNAASKDLQFAAAVASFGMILRGSEHKSGSNIAAVEEIASGAIGEDAGGYRAEFVDLVRKAHSLGAK